MHDITFDWTSTKADSGLKHFASTHAGNHLPLTKGALELIGGDDNQFPNKKPMDYIMISGDSDQIS